MISRSLSVLILRTYFTVRRDTSVTLIAMDPRDSRIVRMATRGDRRMQLCVKWLTRSDSAPRCISMRRTEAAANARRARAISSPRADCSAVMRDLQRNKRRPGNYYIPARCETTLESAGGSELDAHTLEERSYRTASPVAARTRECYLFPSFPLRGLIARAI